MTPKPSWRKTTSFLSLCVTVSGLFWIGYWRYFPGKKPSGHTKLCLRNTKGRPAISPPFLSMIVSDFKYPFLAFMEIFQCVPLSRAWHKQLCLIIKLWFLPWILHSIPFVNTGWADVPSAWPPPPGPRWRTLRGRGAPASRASGFT